MKRFAVGIAAVAILVLGAHTAMGQSKTLSSELRVETGTVEAIEASSRAVTLRKPDGTVVTTVAGPDVKRFAELKVGDKVTARFYDNVVIRVKQPGEAEGYSAVKSTSPSDQAMPGGTRAKQVRISATITGVDMATPSITFTGPNGWKYTSRVQDTEALARVKVGDKVEITWTEAVLVGVEPGT
jgi:Cu/Ag efflux protein CusF